MSAPFLPDTDLEDDLSDGWDMSPRRERAVMAEGRDLFDAPGDGSSDAPGQVSQEGRAEPDAGFDAPPAMPSTRNVLSSAEIEALLRPDLGDMDDTPEEAPAEIVDKAVPDLAAAAVPDQDASKRLSARLSFALRKACGLRAAATATPPVMGAFSEAIKDSPRGGAIVCYAAPNGDIAAMLHLSPELVNALIEGACGGLPDTSIAAPRDLTPIDTALLEALVRPLGTAISDRYSFAQIETDGAFAAALAPPHEADITALTIRIGTASLAATLIAVPDQTHDTPDLEPLAAAASAMTTSTAATVSFPVTAILTARVARLAVPVSKLANLKAGSTLLLGVPADQPVQLLSGGRDGPLVADGQIGRKGQHMALQITSKRV